MSATKAEWDQVGHRPTCPAQPWNANEEAKCTCGLTRLRADSERLAEVEAELEQARRAARNPWEWTDPGSPLQERAARLKAMSGNRDSLITNLERVYVAEGLWFAHEALRIEGRLAEVEKQRDDYRTMLDALMDWRCGIPGHAVARGCGVGYAVQRALGLPDPVAAADYLTEHYGPRPSWPKLLDAVPGDTE